MSGRRWQGRSRWVVGGLVVAMVLTLLTPQSGFTQTTKGSLWTERPVAVAPAPAANEGWVQLVRELKPGVVNISARRTVDAPEGMTNPFGDDERFNQFFRHFFGNQPRRPARSMGSGFVINASGHILTNNHMVANASEIRVKFSDGRELPAKVLGRDAKTDLALIKVEATGLPVIPLGNSGELQVGEAVMAIGNPFGLEQTVTTGIVSATGRVIGEGPYDNFIQTDASINPGNSGGPLINARGQAVGINTAIFTQTGGSVGIGFAIPIDLAKSVVAQLAASGHVVRGYLGVSIQPMTGDLAKSFGISETAGALVSSVVEASPAAKAGVKPGDVITEYNGRKVARSEDLPRAVAETPVGREVPLTVLRDGKPVTLRVTVAKLDDGDTRPAARTKGTNEGKATLGLSLQPLTPAEARERGLGDRGGVLVRGVQEGSPA
ncbi:MAG: Do family serine endopeptidase, partial [Candidatus Rokuibacteriota bacterium]